MLLPRGWSKCEPFQLIFLLIWILLVQKLDTIPGCDCKTYKNLPHLLSGLTAFDYVKIFTLTVSMLFFLNKEISLIFYFT